MKQVAGEDLVDAVELISSVGHVAKLEYPMMGARAQREDDGEDHRDRHRKGRENSNGEVVQKVARRRGGRRRRKEEGGGRLWKSQRATLTLQHFLTSAMVIYINK